ncbi:unnamed protein product [Musa acuminata subsp. malaccensis]|uniref:(wild Malaysian banana) hypothetical protein n=1 Tax=Musa acuminata subsp. malaccensis TaxID=214687 RepID=A0A804K6I9_MUSAM|nr:unnamed protein product [Musa acuminata subsp. malaccensis]
MPSLNSVRVERSTGDDVGHRSASTPPNHYLLLLVVPLYIMQCNTLDPTLVRSLSAEEIKSLRRRNMACDRRAA